MFQIISNDPQGFVMLRCQCGQCKFTEHNLYDFEDGNNCVILKDNTNITCDKCSLSHSSSEQKFILKETEVPASVARHLPECPVCHSLNVYKIGNVKKISSFAVTGVFSSNIGKTMECKNCGYKF